jgi:penicillin-binding protein 1A
MEKINYYLNKAIETVYRLATSFGGWLASRSLKEWLLIFTGIGVACLAVGLGILFFLIKYYEKRLPDVTTLKNYRPSLVSVIYDRFDKPAAEFFVEKRIVKEYSEIPELLKKATIAVEDDKFFTHKGVDFLGILRAALVNLREGGVVQGGSTITQQVAKVMFLSREKTIARKIKELLISQRIEKNFTKEEILEIYLNQIYYGHGTYGVEAASRLYFDKGINELTIGELALLAGLPKSPNSYSPFNNPTGAIHRRNIVINRMLISGYLTPEIAQKATDEPLRLAKQKKEASDIPYFAEHIRRRLYGKLGSSNLYHNGMRIFTTLDLGWQLQAQSALKSGIEVVDRRIGYRGPLGNVDLVTGKIDWEDLNPPVKNSTQAEYYSKNKRYKAVVRSVSKDSIITELNGLGGVIQANGFAWAHPFDPKADGGRVEPVKDATQLVKPGDIIEVKIMEKQGKGPLMLALDQTPSIQGALVCIDYTSGEVRALVGGYDFEKSSFNRAVQAARQPGSSFKPIIYTAALNKEFTPASVVIDAPITFEGIGVDWKPSNFKNEFYGPTTIRTAVIESRNIVTIKVMDKIGISYVVDWAKKLGIKSRLAEDLSLALGSSGLSLLELTSVYGELANGGVRNEPYFIKRVEDKDGKIVERTDAVINRVMPEDTAFLMNNILQGVVEEGTGKAVRALGIPTAGKTGSTNDYIDAWFIGYTSGLVTGIWIGRDHEEPIGKNETGGHAAAPIWLAYMNGIKRSLQIRPFMSPKNILFVRINKKTGLLAKPSDPDSFFEAFRKGTEPTEYGQEKPVGPQTIHSNEEKNED